MSDKPEKTSQAFEKAEGKAKKRENQNEIENLKISTPIRVTRDYKKRRMNFDSSRVSEIVDQLPNEVIEHVFSFLDGNSLLSATLVNKQFSSVVSNSQLLMDKIILVSTGKNNFKEVVNSHRKYQEILLCGKYLKADMKSFKKIGKWVKRIQMRNIETNSLECILEPFPNCEEISLDGYYIITKKDSVLKPETLPNLKSLILSFSYQKQYNTRVLISFLKFEQLESLEINSLTNVELDDVFFLISHQKSLKNLKLDYYGEQDWYHLYDIDFDYFLEYPKSKVDSLEISLQIGEEFNFNKFTHHLNFLEPQKKVKLAKVNIWDDDSHTIFSKLLSFKVPEMEIEDVSNYMFETSFFKDTYDVSLINDDVTKLKLKEDSEMLDYENIHTLLEFFQVFPHAKTLTFSWKRIDDSLLIGDFLKALNTLAELETLYLPIDFPARLIDEKLKSAVNINLI